MLYYYLPLEPNNDLEFYDPFYTTKIRNFKLFSYVIKHYRRNYMSEKHVCFRQLFTKSEMERNQALYHNIHYFKTIELDKSDVFMTVDGERYEIAFEMMFDTKAWNRRKLQYQNAIPSKNKITAEFIIQYITSRVPYLADDILSDSCLVQDLLYGYEGIDLINKLNYVINKQKEQSKK